MHSVVKTGGSLLIIAGVAAALLGYVNSVTAEPIAQQNLKTKVEAMQKVLPAESFGEDVAVNEGIITSYAEGLNGSETAGYAFSVTTKGFGSGLNLMVGMDSEGVVSGVTVVSHSETPGLGAKAEEILSPQYTGKSGDLTVTKGAAATDTEISAITGATITSNAVTNAVNEVQKYYNDNLKGGAN